LTRKEKNDQVILIKPRLKKVSYKINWFIELTTTAGQTQFSIWYLVFSSPSVAQKSKTSPTAIVCKEGNPESSDVETTFDCILLEPLWSSYW
jgi:hypothetical protein